MAAVAKWKWTTASGSLIDLTSTTVNIDAAPTATPRQGGFVLRNRFKSGSLSVGNKNLWTAANLPSASSNVEPVNRMKVLEVPDRTFVRDVQVFAIKSETAPGLTFTPIAAVGASDLDGTVLFAGAYQNKVATSSTSYAAASHLVQITAVNSLAEDGKSPVAGHVFGDVPITKATLALTHLMRSVDSSIASSTKPMATSFFFQQYHASSAGIERTIGHYFPYGGYIYLALGPYNTKLGSAASAADNADYFTSASGGATIDFAGTWEIQARANYVPE